MAIFILRDRTTIQRERTLYLRCSKNPGSLHNSQIHLRYVYAKTVQKRQGVDCPFSQGGAHETDYSTDLHKRTSALAAAASASAARCRYCSHLSLASSSSMIDSYVLQAVRETGSCADCAYPQHLAFSFWHHEGAGPASSAFVHYQQAAEAAEHA